MPAPEPAQPVQLTPSSSSCPNASDDETSLLDLLQNTPLRPDDLLLAAQEKDAGWNAPRLLSTLMMLEVKGLVRRLSDSRYEVRP